MSHTINSVVGKLNEKLGELGLEFTGEPLEPDPATEQFKLKAVSGGVELVIIHRSSDVWWACVSIDGSDLSEPLSKTSLPMLTKSLLPHLRQRLAPQDEASDGEQTEKDAA